MGSYLPYCSRPGNLGVRLCRWRKRRSPVQTARSEPVCGRGRRGQGLGRAKQRVLRLFNRERVFPGDLHPGGKTEHNKEKKSDRREATATSKDFHFSSFSFVAFRRSTRRRGRIFCHIWYFCGGHTFIVYRSHQAQSSSQISQGSGENHSSPSQKSYIEDEYRRSCV